MASWQNRQGDDTASWQKDKSTSDKLMKWDNWQNDMLAKWQGDETASWPNNKSTKC